MSQLIERLKELARKEPVLLKRVEYEARLAANEARIGAFEVAHRRLDKLRASHSGTSSSGATVWIMFAEAILNLYQDLGPGVLDRLQRVFLLSRSLGDLRLAALTAAWKAHVEFEHSRYDEMRDSIAHAHTSLDADEFEGRTRLAIVLSNAFWHAGDPQNAGMWFSAGRRSAIESGDRVSIEALQYNKASFSLAYYRVESCRRDITADELQLLIGEISTARNLQALTQFVALANHVELWSARLAMLRGEWATAIDLLSVARHRPPYLPHNFSQELVELELAYCHWRLNDVFAAQAALDKAKSLHIDELDLDERIVANWFLRQLCTAGLVIHQASEHLVRSRELFDRLDQERGALRQSVLGVITPAT